MKHSYHGLLPVQLQNILMEATKSGRMDFLDEAISQVQALAPDKFHTDKTLAQRKFYNEPRRVIPNAGFIHPVPPNMSRA